MKQHKLLTIILIITGSISIVFSGCQRTQQVTEEQPKPPIVTPAEVINIEPNTPTPTIQFDETSVDFGQVGPGTVNKRELKFHNTGKAVLKISEVSQCCGIVPKLDKEQYEPGDTGILTIEFHASGFIGTLERNPVVYSNDPEHPAVDLLVKAEIIQKVLWEPESLKLFLNVENAGCPKLKIWCIDGQPFAITGIRSTGDCITAAFDPTSKKTEHVLDLKVNMEKLPDQLNGEIDVSMNHPQGDFAAIFFNVVPKYSLSPKPLYVFHLKENVPHTEKVRVINNYHQDIEIDSTSSKENTIKMVKYDKTDEGLEVTLEITPPPAPEGQGRFSDIFYINLKDGEQLALNFTGYYD